MTQSGLVVQAWDANSDNDRAAVGRVLFNSKPVAGARISVDGYAIPQATAKNGSFTYPVDITVTGRHVATVTGAAGATIAGRPLSEAQQSAVQGLQAGFSVGYAIDGLKARRQANGTVLVTGRARTASRRRPTAGRALHVPAERHRHRRDRQAGAGRDRRHPHGRPRLLDVLVAERRARPLHLVLLGLRRARRQPRAARGAGRRRAVVVRRRDRHELQFQAAEQRDARRPARKDDGCATGRRDADELPRRGLRRAHPGSQHRRPRDQARVGALARRERQLLDGAARFDARQDTALLGEPPAVLLALPCPVGRAGRPRARGRPSSARRSRPTSPPSPFRASAAARSAASC